MRRSHSLHGWYSIISHRTLSKFLTGITYSTSTSGPSHRESSLGSQFMSVFHQFSEIFALFCFSINNFFFIRKGLLKYNIYRKFVRGYLDLCNFCLKSFVVNSHIQVFANYISILCKFFTAQSSIVCKSLLQITCQAYTNFLLINARF